MAKPRNKVIDLVVYLLMRVVVMILRMFSLRANYRACRLAARLFCVVSRRHFGRAKAHIERSFPTWAPRRVDRVARESIRNMLYMFVEMLYTPQLIQPHRWRRHVTLKDIGPLARLLLERKTPVVLVTGHVGNWEIAGYTMACIGFPSYTVARHLDNPHVNDFIFDVRERAGQRMIYKKGAAEGIQRAMARKAPVCFVCDQDAGRKGVYVDFFGRKASTFKSIALMAMEYGTPLAVVVSRRLGDRFEFEITAPRIIHPREWADRPDPLEWITQEYTTALERFVRTVPQQYFWVHRRWKHRPKGERRTPDGIA